MNNESKRFFVSRKKPHFETRHIYFVSAFADRGAPAFRKLVAEIAWGTFACFMSEPDKLIAFRQGHQDKLSALLALD